MRLTWFPIDSVRRPLVGLVLAVVLLVGVPSVTLAQEAAQEPAKPTLSFSNDAGVIILYVKADKTADFEELMAKFKEALVKMEAPEAKQQAESLKIFKGPVGGGTAVYMLVADPVVKAVEYWFLSILYKGFPAEAKALYDKWTDVKAATPPAVFDLTQVNK